MTLRLDHVVIAVPDLEIAMHDYEALGFTVIRGGVHGNRATHNALIVFADGTYLELLAPTGEASVPAPIDFSRMLWREGLTGFALGTDDLESEAARLREAGFGVGEIIPGARQRPDGTLIEWKLALINDGFAPFLIQDVTPRERRVPGDAASTTHPNGVSGVQGIVMKVHDVALSQEVYDRQSGYDLRIIPVSAEDLDAVQLKGGSGRFDIEKTHGVWFEREGN